MLLLLFCVVHLSGVVGFSASQALLRCSTYLPHPQIRSFPVSSLINRSSLRNWHFTRNIQLFESNGNVPSVDNTGSDIDSVVQLQVLRSFHRTTWFSWWVQTILSVISGVTLLFARQQSRGISVWISGYAFNVISVIVAFVNVFWTWNCALLCKRLQRNKASTSVISQNLRRYAKVAITIGIVGTILNIIAAEQIVGNLASKILSSQPAIFSTGGLASLNANNVFQALDIFLVQANTNTLVSHFSPLVSYLWLLQFSVQRLQSKQITTAQ